MTLKVIYLLALLPIFATAELCPEANLTQTGAQSRLDSATVLLYSPGVYAVAYGSSPKDLTEAKNKAKLELIKQLNSRITFVLQVIDSSKKGEWSQEKVAVEASFDQMPLVRSDANLVCKGGNLYWAEAHLKMDDYVVPLKQSYEDSAQVFRVAIQQAMDAKDKAHFNTAWTRASRMHKSVVASGKYLMAVLAEASRGRSYDISAVLDKGPFPPFIADMKLWQLAVGKKETNVNNVQLAIVPQGPVARILPLLTTSLAGMGITVSAANDSEYKLTLSATESGYDGAYGGLFTCEVTAPVELRAKNKSLGKKILRSGDWKVTAADDSTVVCDEAWSKVTPEQLEKQIKPFLGSYLPLQ
jgi:hypothetical protein